MPPNEKDVRQNYEFQSRHYAPSPVDSLDPNHPIMPDIVVPPVYTIDLSLPPRERYTRVAADYIETLRLLPPLFDEAIGLLNLPVKPCHVIARLLFRRLYSFEQTQELKGISEVCKVPMYLLVAFNVFIDAIMGCTSGGAVVNEPGSTETTMMHFRAFDWVHDSLRNAIAQFEFVDKAGGEVIARTLGYVGQVGVLTGVRKGLSISLNCRPTHNSSLMSAERAEYYWNTLMVLLGRRRGIATVLREYLLPRPVEEPKRRLRLFKRRKQEDEESWISTTLLPAYGMDDVVNVLPTVRTSVAYLIFSTAAETVTLEKDILNAKIFRSSTFIVTGNHDASAEPGLHAYATEAPATEARIKKLELFAARRQELLDDSFERERDLLERWQEWKEEQARERNEEKRGMSFARLLELIRFVPLISPDTHFLCVMDPREGVFRWVERFPEGVVERQGKAYPEGAGKSGCVL